MEMVIITGMSGAGKSGVINTMEDIGYYCIDNLPVKLIGKFAELASQSDGTISHMAMVVDVRGGAMFNELYEELDALQNQDYRLLFLDCDDHILINRYKETRRKHPLANSKNPSLQDALTRERVMLKPAKERADYTVNTTHLSTGQLRERIQKIFLNNTNQGMLVNCMSFGFKHGYPSEADLLFDVRCLPNPFYIPELKAKTGLDDAVHEYVMQFDQAKELRKKIIDLIDYLLPLYQQEGKTQLVVAFGCTGGKHRSVTFAEELYAHLQEQGAHVTVNHRDITK